MAAKPNTRPVTPRVNTLVEWDWERPAPRPPTTAEIRRADAQLKLWARARDWLTHLHSETKRGSEGARRDHIALVRALARGAPRSVVERLDRQRAEIARADAIVAIAVAGNGVAQRVPSRATEAQRAAGFDELPRVLRTIVARRLRECCQFPVQDERIAWEKDPRLDRVLAPWNEKARQAISRCEPKAAGRIDAAVRAVALATGTSRATLYRAWSAAREHVYDWTDMDPEEFLSELSEAAENSDG